MIKIKSFYIVMTIVNNICISLEVNYAYLYLIVLGMKVIIR